MRSVLNNPDILRVRRCRPLLGTFVEIEAEGLLEDRLHEAIERAFGAVAQTHRLMSFHDSESDLSRLNASAGETVEVDPWTYEVLEAAGEFHHLSGGAFDPTVGGGGWDGVELLEGHCVRLKRAGLRLDLGGIAKGFAVDRAVEALRESGAEAGIVNAGGDLRVFGECAWPVAISDPRAAMGDPLETVFLRDAALATSGPYFGERSLPSAHSVTVRAPCALWADALTKIVLALKEEAFPLLRRRDAACFMVTAWNNERIQSEAWQ